MRVSHEPIYRTLFVQARGALRKELTACLRTQRTQRRSLKRTEHSGTGRIRGMVRISERHSQVEDRAMAIGRPARGKGRQVCDWNPRRAIESVCGAGALA